MIVFSALLKQQPVKSGVLKFVILHRLRVIELLIPEKRLEAVRVFERFVWVKNDPHVGVARQINDLFNVEYQVLHALLGDESLVQIRVGYRDELHFLFERGDAPRYLLNYVENILILLGRVPLEQPVNRVIELGEETHLLEALWAAIAKSGVLQHVEAKLLIYDDVLLISLFLKHYPTKIGLVQAVHRRLIRKLRYCLALEEL